MALDQVEAVAAPADPAVYGHPVLRDQITGGSVTIRGFYEPMRRAGATARVMLIAAAAREWGVDPLSCRAEAGQVLHPSSGRRLAYGALAAKAAEGPVPETVELKPASEFRLIGKPHLRIDTPAKVNGTAKFGLDARPEGVKFAAVMLSPSFGGTLKTVDDSRGAQDQRRAAGGEAERRRRRGRRPYRRRPQGARRAASHLGCRAQWRARHRRAGAPHRNRHGRRGAGGARPWRCRRGGSGRRPRHRGGLPHADPRPFGDGADELHRACARRFLRGLGRHAGGRACPAGRRRGHRPAAREGDGAQPVPRRRLRPAARLSTASPWPCASPSRSTGRCRWCGAARRTSATTATATSTSAG